MILKSKTQVGGMRWRWQQLQALVMHKTSAQLWFLLPKFAIWIDYFYNAAWHTTLYLSPSSSLQCACSNIQHTTYPTDRQQHWDADERHPCHALFHTAHVTETVTPFTTAYLNMIPNNVNNSAIYQLGLQCRNEWGQKNMSKHWHFNQSDK